MVVELTVIQKLCAPIEHFLCFWVFLPNIPSLTTSYLLPPSRESKQSQPRSARISDASTFRDSATQAHAEAKQEERGRKSASKKTRVAPEPRFSSRQNCFCTVIYFEHYSCRARFSSFSRFLGPNIPGAFFFSYSTVLQEDYWCSKVRPSFIALPGSAGAFRESARSGTASSVPHQLRSVPRTL